MLVPPIQAPPLPGNPPTPEFGIKKIVDAINSAYKATLGWGKDNLTEVTNDECLLGAIHQFRMWQVSFNTTYALFATQSPKYLHIDGTIDDMAPTKPMTPILDRSFTTNSEREKPYIKNSLDLGIWAAKADWTQTELSAQEGIGEGSVYNVDQQHQSIIAGIEACKEALEKIDKDQLGYNNAGLVVALGLLMLQTPNAVDIKDLAMLIEDIDKKLDANRDVLIALSMVPAHEDENIENLLKEFMGMRLDDYVDNILTGRIFGLGEGASHAAALVNMLAMAEGLLAPCLSMINGGKTSLSALSGATSDVVAGIGKLIATITSYIEMATRTVTETAIDIALAAIGGSSAVIKSMMGLKMQIQELQKKGEQAIRNISIGKMMATPGPGNSMGECPITALLNVESAKAMAEAGIKNALMMPLMALANEILKPILEMISDIAGEIMSLQSMLGESLAAAFNMVSMQRWVDYVLVYQLAKMREYTRSQIEYYQEIKQYLTTLKNRLKPQDTRYAMLDRIFRSYVHRIASIAAKHDEIVNSGGYAYDKTAEAIRLLGAVSALLIKRTADNTDKDDVMATMQRFDTVVERGIGAWEDAQQDIKEAGKNLEGMWKELTQIRFSDLVGRELKEFGDTFREYAKLFRVIFGQDLDALIDQLEELLWGTAGPKPAPVILPKPNPTTLGER